MHGDSKVTRQSRCAKTISLSRRRQYTGAGLDPGDLRNMPWLLDIRGARDYMMFMNLVMAKKAASEVSKSMNVPTLAFEHTNEAFAHYRAWSPAAPGFYSFDSKKLSDSGMSCVQPGN